MLKIIRREFHASKSTVSRATYALDFNTKAKFVNVVYAYFITQNPKYNIVVLYDSQTGKEVGKYAEVYGGLKLE